ncbi:MAG: HlyD family efflux transporter periplasmic adaptor subunit, partial [Myxococcales bacterium]|nr:HlyD family efflux transporter periplasmic adaptor subunit [Myxococcales bacterium]
AANVWRVLRGTANAAAKRSEALPAASDDDQLAPLQARLSAAELRIAQLTRERDGLALRAPADGVIDALPLHAGDLAAPELPVATLVAPDAMRVVACIPESRSRALEPGLEADITSTFDKTTATGAVESVTGTIGPLPPRCQPPGSKVTLMGRVAIVALDEPMGGLPGQTQLVKISARRRPLGKQPRPAPPPPQTTPPTPSAPPATVPGPEQPAVLTVPSELYARSRFEPSGLVWVPSLDRYIVVSDDTGLPKSDDHAPWLFTMSAAGVVDKQPLVVAGLGEVSDLESITVDAAGGLWLMASQSESKKGKRPEARRRLAHVVIAKTGELRADHVIDFLMLLEAAPPQTRAALGVLDTQSLDIEGMAYSNGALYLGLKAPTDTDGRAMIWKVAAPDKLLVGDLAGAQLSVWARVKLSVQADGRGTAGGIADMAFFDADTLVIAVTASGVNPQTQAGAIYTIKATGGDVTARHVRTFADGKPEGVAITPGGKALAVTFDRGKDAPQWVVIPADQLKK